MKLAVVTVNYGSARLVLDGLAALVPQLRELGGAQAWIVDNRSPDDSVAVLREGVARNGWGDVVEILASPVNGGYGAGNNIAFRRGLTSADPPEYFYLLNPDAIPDPGAVRGLVDFLDAHPEAGVAGGRLRDADGSTQCSTFRFPSLWSELEAFAELSILTRLLRHRRVHLDPPLVASPVDWVSGASMMVRRRVLEEVGLFDEDFFLYFEEVDLCRRIRAAGFEIYFVPDTSVEHLSGATTGMGVRSRRLPRYWYQSRAHYFRKAAGPLGARLFDVVAVAATCVRRLRELVGRKPPRSPGFLRDFIRYGWRDEPLHRSAGPGAAPPEGENRHDSSHGAVG